MKAKYKLILVALIACCSTHLYARQKLRVYFIGNSYTYVNTLPQMIKDVAASMGDTLVYEEHDPGGYTLKDHMNPPQDPCMAKIKSGTWHFIVLQEQSQLPAISNNSFYNNTYAYATTYTNIIRDSAKCTRAMFYMTWGRKNGDVDLCPGVQHLCTYHSMDSILRSRYMELTDSFNASVSPVGAVRRYLRNNYPGLELYEPDGSHPSLAGTYAAACAFYTVLFRKDPSLITYNSMLNATDAANIKAAAKKVAFDSLSYWQHDPTVLFPGFNVKYETADSVSFTNTSTNAVSYAWRFGDGKTSTQKNAGHRYATGGSYTVSLTITDVNGCSRTVYEMVNITAAAVGTVKNNGDISLMPNPATDRITIRWKQPTEQAYNIVISSIDGKALYSRKNVNTEKQDIDISALHSGLYFISIYANGYCVYKVRFVKE